MTSTDGIAAQLRTLAAKELPKPPGNIRTAEYATDLAAYFAKCDHLADMTTREAGQLVAEVCDAKRLSGIAPEATTYLRDMRTRGEIDSTAMQSFFWCAAFWLTHHQLEGQMPEVEHKFPVHNDDEKPPVAMTPSQKIEAQHEWLRSTLLAFADLIAAGDGKPASPASKYESHYFAVATGSTLHCTRSITAVKAAWLVIREIKERGGKLDDWIGVHRYGDPPGDMERLRVSEVLAKGANGPPSKAWLENAGIKREAIIGN